VPDTEFKLERIDDLALVTIDNGEGESKPTFFSRAALASLDRVLGELESGAFAAAVLTGKPGYFAAGADLTEFPNATRELALAGSRAGHELFARLRDLPFPTVAAINGACLGGGVEIALHCSARTISTAVRHFACPECFLGIVPAWGGTQLVPRLVGPQAAATVVALNPMRQNRMLGGVKAHELGFADRLLEPGAFLDESIAFAHELAGGGAPERTEPDFSELAETIRRARAELDDVVHGAAPAPYRALELIEGAASWTIQEGYRAEEEAVAELLPGRQAQASLYAFDLVERRAKHGVGVPDVAPREIRKVGIVGAGLMASQIGALFVRRLRVPVVLRDLDQETVELGLASIREELEAAASRGRITEDEARRLGAVLSGTTGWDGFEDCDLVLEAVFEELEVKKKVFAELRGLVRPNCILATNTSSLPVAEMGADVGLHFFNPVALMPLLEIVVTPATDDATLATAWSVSQGLGKRGVVVKDAPGFVVNRVLTRFTRVLMDALEHGNTIEEVDEAVLSLGMPMAPSMLLGLVGPRVANQVLETMHEAYPDRFPLSPALAALAEGNEIQVVDERRRTKEEIVGDALEAVADEVARLLEEGVVPEAKDIDTCLILGAGWPFFMGGVTKYLDQTGVSERLFGRPFADVGAAAPA
jgi:3-hydroxyacyl-CoA dehydrogenase/enoyl-CoA hydratase/carnithine racemase